MHISVVAVNEINTFVTAQIVKSLLHRQPVLAPELKDEDDRPFQFFLYIILPVGGINLVRI